MQTTPELPIGARGRITEVLCGDTARAAIDGRSVIVVSARGGPFSCGDAARSVGEQDGRVVVEVRNTRSSYPLVLSGWGRRWAPLPVR